jgi:tripeptide aminopeptidase
MTQEDLVNEKRLLDTFLALVRIESPSGEEDEIALYLLDRLKELGVEAERDRTGNVIGRWPGKGDAVALLAHMDTVRPVRGIRPVVEDGIVRTDGTTILGADDKSAIAEVLEMVAIVGERGIGHIPLEIVFTVGEETGLLGANGLDCGSLQAKWGVILDDEHENQIVSSAPYHLLMHAKVRGKPAHAGLSPEEGVNAIRVAAEAVSAMKLGRIDEETTANIGYFHGGEATNIVTPLVELRWETRSLDEAKVQAQNADMVRALEEAANRYGAELEMELAYSHEGYQWSEDDLPVKRLAAAMRTVGLKPVLAGSMGGTDANVLNVRGIPAVVMGTGMRKPHAMDEHIAVADMVRATRVLVALATENDS